MMSRWSAASIRVRLTGWYAAVLAMTLVVYATATFLAVRHEFLEQLDLQLHNDLETDGRSLTQTPGGQMSWPGRGNASGDDEPAHDAWSVNGEQLYRSGASVALPPLLVTRSGYQTGYESIEVNGQHWRTFTERRAVGVRDVMLRVSRSEESLRGQLWEVLLVLVFGLPLVVVLAGIGGYILARRALAPIDHLAADARRITADRLHERLSVRNQQDEIGRLAAVINDTFARLDTSFERLRRFTADASHELRTPLAVIRGIGEAGLAEPRSAADYRDAMGSMLEEVDRLTNLVDTLLRLSHADAGTVRLAREPIDLSQLAREVISSLGILGEERNQRFIVDAPERVPVSADRQVLREALTNIVDNAIKYSPSGSIIEVAVRVAGHEGVVSVADQGPGILAQHRERIFDRFFRVDEGRSRDRGGSGLGLAIAKWAVEINGGHIEVEQRPTSGSVFHVFLPLSDRPVIEPRHARYEQGTARSADNHALGT
jgi:heavy metal sensor kinase